MIATIAGHRHEAFRTRLGHGDPADFARLETWKVFAYRGVAADAAAEAVSASLAAMVRRLSGADAFR